MVRTNGWSVPRLRIRRVPCRFREAILLAFLVAVTSGCGTLGIWQNREANPRAQHQQSQWKPSFWRSWFAEPEPPPPPASTREFMQLKRLDP